MHDVIGILAGFMCLKYVKKSVLYRPAWKESNILKRQHISELQAYHVTYLNLDGVHT